MKKRILHSVFFTFLILNQLFAYAQTIPQGMKYQAVARDASGIAILNQAVNFRFSFYSNSPTGTLVWQEVQLLTTDNYGLVQTIVGVGATTGAGTASSFSQINWSAATYYLKVSIDITGGTSYSDLGTSQLFSVPYSFYSSSTNGTNSFSLSDMNDVNLSGIAIGKLLKWNGSFWMPSNDNDSDTVLYSFNALHSNTTDTALYSFGMLTSDTTQFSYQSDSALFAPNALNTNSTNSATYADTALYVLSSPATAWLQSGNSISASAYYLGTNDNKDVVFRTNNLSQATLRNDGRLAIGNSLATSSMNLLGDDGLLAVGTFGSSYNSVSGAGTKMLWYPSKGVFRAGGISSNQWDTINTGKYSMSFGYNSKANSCSFSSGFGCQAIDYSIALGRKSQANGVGAYPTGNVMAIGDSCIGYAYRSVTLGRGNFADSTALSNGSTQVLIGYKNSGIGVVSVCLGSYCYSGGTRCVAIGYHAYAANAGSFVYSDASSSSNTSSTVNNQFLIRASGGVIFYSDSLNTMGVMLNPGSGSWSVVSDKHKKENFLVINYEAILSGIDALEIKKWNYKSQSKSIHHIGPMAQDFYSAFHFGENNITISTMDMDGVILSGIKALRNRIDTLQNVYQNDSFKSRIVQLDNSEELNKRLDLIEAAINKN